MDPKYIPTRIFMVILMNNTRKFCTEHNLDESHGFSHFCRVMQHAQNALKYEPETVNFMQIFAILIASLLHDVDDAKYFLSNDFENARYLINISKTEFEHKKATHIGLISQEWIESVIKMISLVSCSKNGNRPAEHKWMLIPRLADRLDALGENGIKRVVEYGISIGRPIHTENTIRVYSIDELNKIATLERFNQYLAGNGEKTTVGHIYDKIIHIGRPEYFGTDNEYLIREANKGRIEIEKMIIEYWNEVNFEELLNKISE